MQKYFNVSQKQIQHDNNVGNVNVVYFTNMTNDAVGYKFQYNQAVLARGLAV